MSEDETESQLSQWLGELENYAKVSEDETESQLSQWLGELKTMQR